MRAARIPVQNEIPVRDVSSSESHMPEGAEGPVGTGSRTGAEGDDEASQHSEDSSPSTNVRSAVEGQVSCGNEQGLPAASTALPEEKNNGSSRQLRKDEDRPADIQGNITNNVPMENTDPTYVSAPQPKLRRTSSSMSMQPTSLPKVDCQEKIFLCIDTSDEMFVNKFKAQSMSQTSVFKTLVSAIKQFVRTKSYLNSKHQFSLVTLSDDDNVQLITDFSSGHENLIPMLNDIAESKMSMRGSQKNPTELVKPFNLSSLFNLIKMQTNLPTSVSKNKAKYPPTHVVRVIFVYGRSRSLIEFIDGQKDFLMLNGSPYFFLDCVYIHEPLQQTNSVENIFAELCALDLKGMSHVYEVATDKNMACLYNIFAKLLAHPLQRPTQGEGSINFNLSLD